MNQYYLYIYLDPRKPGKFEYNGISAFDYEPIYVGKGKGNRVYSHLKEAVQKSETECNSVKFYKIKKILTQGYKPVILVLEYGSENHILERESLYISAIGKYTDKTGPLTNIKDDNSYSVPKQKTKRNTNYQVGKRYVTIFCKDTSETMQIEEQYINDYLSYGYECTDEWTRPKQNNNKSRHGKINPMYGKSAVQGRKWVIINNQDCKFLTAEEISNIKEPFEYGRSVNKNKRKRVIIRGNEKSKYMTDVEIDSLPEGTQYQFGLTWKNDETRILIKEKNNGISETQK